MPKGRLEGWEAERVCLREEEGLSSLLDWSKGQEQSAGQQVMSLKRAEKDSYSSN